jgi:SAM-dependent methyltransferase
MKISDGIKLEGKFVRIPGASRNDLPAFFKEMGFKVGAEIGALKGEFTERFCKEGLKMYAIDPWIMFKDYMHPRGQRHLDAQFEETKARLAPYDATVIRKTSMDAVNDFEDNSLDFVYIDGNHHFRYIAEDLCEWTRKVRKGGVISGHDFFYSLKIGENAQQVRWAVEAFIGAYNIKTCFILGKQSRPDKWPSWMFIKEDWPYP